MDTGSVPKVIGSFRIVSKLGQGGMGAVYRAVHGTLERPVALKILPAELASNAEYVARFLREARTVAQLRHENVVQVYDAGEQNGQYYIAMELVDGCSLQNYVDQKKPISEKDGLGLLLQAAKGLAAAHAKGLVHRDIKPENMLLGKDHILRLVDFGLVMESASTSQLTTTGAFLGTPMYMSPEQADGEHADARTDLYSLGVTFFRVFTGQPPFNSGTVLNLLFKHKFQPPPDPQSLRPDLSQDARNLLLHLLAKRREDRPSSSQALVEMIEGIAQGKPVPPPTPFVPLDGGAAQTLFEPPPGARQNPAGKGRLLAASLLLAILALGVFIALNHHGESTALAPPDPPKRAEPPAEKPAPPVEKPAPPDFGARGDVAFEGGRYAEALENYAKALEADPGNAELTAKKARAEEARKYASAMQAAQALEEKGDLEGAAAGYEEALALDRGTEAREHLERLRSQIAKDKGLDAAQRNVELDAVCSKAGEAEKAGDFGAAAESYSRAAGLAQGNDKIVFADKAHECRRKDYQSKGAAAERLNDSAEAEKWYRKAQDLKYDPLLSQRIEALRLKINSATEAAFDAALREGQKAFDNGDFARSRKLFGDALSLKPGNPDAAAKLREAEGRELLAKGDASRGTGNMGDALSAYTEALQKCPALAAVATARIQALDVTKGPTDPAVPADSAAAVGARIDALVKAQKNSEALAEAMTALRANPDSKELKDLKASLESMLACGDVYAELQKLVESGLSRVRDARDIDDDDRAREWRDALEKLRDLYPERARKARPLFQAHDHPGVQSCLVAARSDAVDLAAELSTVAEGCDRKADKAAEKGGIKGPFGFSLGMGGDKKKAEKYRNLCEALRKLAEQARAQSK